MKTTANSYIDRNGNVWTKNEYTFEQASIASKSLVNCYGCINCVACNDCTDCVSCVGCVGCKRCNSCQCCSNCADSADCIRCDGFTRAKELPGDNNLTFA